MKSDNPFAKLGAIDQQLFQDTSPKTVRSSSQNTGNPENKKSGNLENNISRNQENLNTGNQEIKKSSIPDIQNTQKREFYTKATYRLSDEALDAVDDAKKMLKREYKLKVNLEEIVETAIIDAYKDLLQNKEKSRLVSKYSGNPENKNT